MLVAPAVHIQAQAQAHKASLALVVADQAIAYRHRLAQIHMCMDYIRL